MEVAKVSQSSIPESSPKEAVSSGQKEKNSKDFGNLVTKAAAKIQNKDKTTCTAKTADATKTEDAAKASDTVKASGKDTAETKESGKDKLKNMEDLKKFIDEILSGDDAKTDLSQNASDLLSMLSMLIKNIQTGKQDLTLDKENILSSIKSKLNLSDANFTKLSGILDKINNSQIINNKVTTSQVSNNQVIINQAANAQVTNNQEISNLDTTSTDIKQEILNLLSSMENNSDKDNTNNVSTDIKNNHVSLKEVLPELKQILASNSKNAENTNTDKGKKEADFLNSLASGDKKDDVSSKVTNLMNHFTVNKNSEVNVVKEPEVINQKTIANDIIKTLKYMETSDIKNLTVKITPKELGEITVNLTVEAGVMKATITAANKDSYNLIQGNLQDINSKLVNNDVKISTLSLNLYNEDTTYYSGQFNGNNFNDGNNKRQNNVSKIFLEEEDASDSDYDLNSNVNKLA